MANCVGQQLASKKTYFRCGKVRKIKNKVSRPRRKMPLLDDGRLKPKLIGSINISKVLGWGNMDDGRLRPKLQRKQL